MKKLYFLATVLFAALSMTALVGCEEPAPVEPTPGPKPTDQPVIEVESVIELSVEGGATVINYTITNPVEGARLSANTDAEWISGLSTQVEGTITFLAAPNMSDETREATIELLYSSVSSSITVRQLATAAMVDASFSAEIVEQSYYYCTLNLTPEDLELEYIMDIFLMEDIEAYGLESDEDFYNYLIEYYASIGSWSGLSGLDVASQKAKKGVREGVKLSGIKPGGKALFIAFYFDTYKGRRISDVFRFEFSGLEPEIEELGFSYQFEIDGPTATATVTPDREDTRYYFDVMPKSLLDEVSATEGLSKEEYIKKWWTDTVYADMQGDTPASLIWEQNCSLGVDSYTFDLLADTEYYIFSFGVNEEAVCNTVPQFEVFKTGSVDLSNLTFELTVSNLTKCGVKIEIKASNDTDPYVAGLITAEEWYEFGDTNSERLSNILKHYNVGSPAYGNGMFEEQKKLTPDTAYVFYTFGYNGGVVTTSLYNVEFKTLQDIDSNVTVSVKDLGYYDIWDINMYDPSFGYLGIDNDDFAVMPVEIEVSDDTADVYFYTWWISPDSDLAWVTDENRFGRFLYWGPQPRVMWCLVGYDTESWVGAMAKDKDGYYSKQYLDKRPCTRDGVGDAQVFLEWLNAHPEAEAYAGHYIDELYK